VVCTRASVLRSVQIGGVARVHRLPWRLIALAQFSCATLADVLCAWCGEAGRTPHRACSIRSPLNLADLLKMRITALTRATWSRQRQRHHFQPRGGDADGRSPGTRSQRGGLDYPAAQARLANSITAASNYQSATDDERFAAFQLLYCAAEGIINAASGFSHHALNRSSPFRFRGWSGERWSWSTMPGGRRQGYSAVAERLGVIQQWIDFLAPFRHRLHLRQQQTPTIAGSDPDLDTSRRVSCACRSAGADIIGSAYRSPIADGRAALHDSGRRLHRGLGGGTLRW